MKLSYLFGLTVFVVLFAVFVACPVHDTKDSRYSLVLSQAILERRSFKLDGYFVPRHEKWPTHFETVNGHRYYYFPMGSSVLSIPFVAAVNALGVSTVQPDRHYDEASETLIQYLLASALMAGFGVMVASLASDILSSAWWLLVLAGVEFGSPVMSTASRTLWSDSWGIFLIGWVVWTLVRLDADQDQPRPVWLATLLSWSYFVRPTNSVAIIGITVYLLACHREMLWRYVLTGIAWLTGFMAFAWYNFGHLLPSYFQPSRLAPAYPLRGLLANLISPSRGVIVFVPTLMLVAYLLTRYWTYLPHRRLVMVALGILPLHLIAVSSYWQWWAGHSYGPRFMAGMVPWFAFLALVGIKGMLNARAAGGSSLFVRRCENTLGVIALIASIIINSYGAISPAADRWNFQPLDIDDQPARVFDWRHPQFLAGLWLAP